MQAKKTRVIKQKRSLIAGIEEVHAQQKTERQAYASQSVAKLGLGDVPALFRDELLWLKRSSGSLEDRFGYW